MHLSSLFLLVTISNIELKKIKNFCLNEIVTPENDDDIFKQY